MCVCVCVCVCVLVTQSCSTLCDPVGRSPPGSSVHEILQERILEWFAILFSRGSSRPRDPTRASLVTDRFFTISATGDIFHSALSSILCTNGYLILSSYTLNRLAKVFTMDFRTPHVLAHHSPLCLSAPHTLSI